MISRPETRLRRAPALSAPPLIVLLVLLWLGACGGGDSDVFILKVAASAPADDPGPQTLQLFVDRVNEASGGRIDARLYAGSALGEDRDVTEGLKLGTVEMLMSPSSTLATFVPEMYVFELPFLFDDRLRLLLNLKRLYRLHLLLTGPPSFVHDVCSRYCALFR